MIGFHGVFEGIQKKTMFIAGDWNEFCLIQMHALEIAEERRIFNQDHITWIDQCFAQQIHCLCGTGHGENRRNGTADFCFGIAF